MRLGKIQAGEFKSLIRIQGAIEIAPASTCGRSLVWMREINSI